MSIQQQTVNGVLVLKPSGRLDSSNSIEFERVLLDILDTGQDKLMVDFTELDYISSAGLRVILVAAKKMRTLKGYLALFGLRANVKEVFEISGFDNIFNIYPDMQAAMQDANVTL